MMPEERRKKILELIYENENKSITVKSLCDSLMASEATIRRDLGVLQEEGKLERTHGGAMLSTNMPLEREDTFVEKERVRTIEKLVIAQEAIKLIKPHDSIFLDSGTTTLELAKLIGKASIPLHVFTNSPLFSSYLAKNPKVEQFIIGGKIRNNTLAAIGQPAVDMIRGFRIDKVFIGINGISMEHGLTTPDFEEAQVKRAMIDNARERYLLADASKFDKVALCTIAPVSAIDLIITSEVDVKTWTTFENEGVHIIEANKERV